MLVLRDLSLCNLTSLSPVAFLECVQPSHDRSAMFLTGFAALHSPRIHGLLINGKSYGGRRQSESEWICTFLFGFS